MANLVDPHAHLLYGVDDGVNDREEMLQVAHQYVEMGYTAVLCTPHYYPGVFEVRRSQNAALMHSMQQELDQAALPLKLYLGNEFFLHKDIVREIKAGRASTLNDSRYVLIEFPMTSYQAETERILDSLRNEDYVPIIAHPERYDYFLHDPHKLLRYIKQGCLIQVNAGSLSGQFGTEIKQLANNLLASDMVHLIGTDTHSKGARSPRVMKELFKEIDHPELETILYKNPLHLLHDKEITRELLPDYQEVKKKRRFPFFL